LQNPHYCSFQEPLHVQCIHTGESIQGFKVEYVIIQSADGANHLLFSAFPHHLQIPGLLTCCCNTN